MSSAARVTRPPAPVATPARVPRRFTVEEYHRLAEIGVLKSGDRCELIRGLILEKPVVNPPHATVVSKLMQCLIILVGRAVTVRGQQPITLADSEPEPDVALATGTHNDYATVHPGPGQVVLVVEVSDSSLPDDQTDKLRLYATNRLPVYWIVNIPARRVEVYTRPRGGKNPTYRTQAVYAPGDVIPVVVGGAELGAVAVADLFPGPAPAAPPGDAA